jgi:hypothetical protein
MLVNTSQMMDNWTLYFSPKVKESNWLGLLVNMFNIGAILSFFITYVLQPPGHAQGNSNTDLQSPHCRPLRP